MKKLLAYLILATILILASCTAATADPDTPPEGLSGACTLIKYDNPYEDLRAAGKCTATGNALAFKADTPISFGGFPELTEELEINSSEKLVTYTLVSRDTLVQSNTTRDPLKITSTATSWEASFNDKLDLKFILGIDTNIIKNPIDSIDITNNTEVKIDYVGNHPRGRPFAGAGNESPYLKWHSIKQAKSSIILAYDITGGNWIHWLRVNETGNSISKGAGSTANARNGHTTWFTQDPSSEKKYYGPQNPQHGGNPHTYRFAVFGIDKASITLPAAFADQGQLTDQLINALGSSPNYNINNKYGTTDESFRILSVGYIDTTY